MVGLQLHDKFIAEVAVPRKLRLYFTGLRDAVYNSEPDDVYIGISKVRYLDDRGSKS